MTTPQNDLDGLIGNWTFVPSTPPSWVHLARIKSCVMGLRRAPATLARSPVTSRKRWNVYFIYSPDGQLAPAHRYTLQRLRELDGGLMVICATRSPELLPAELTSLCDAVYWKDLPGYDFSAYSFALREVATLSPSADLLLMNDSVLGPFGDLDRLLATTPWQLTGFTAWCAFENHLQSYALFFRNVTPAVARRLGTVLPRSVAFNRFQQVVNCQETRLARVAAGTLSVGALWFAPADGDPAIVQALSLLRSGFPFVKRSLAGGKYAHRVDRQELEALLAERAHPI